MVFDFKSVTYGQLFMTTSITCESFPSLSQDCIEGFHNWQDLWNEDKRKCLDHMLERWSVAVTAYACLLCNFKWLSSWLLLLLLLEFRCPKSMRLCGEFTGGIPQEGSMESKNLCFAFRFCCWKKGRGCPQTHYATKTEASRCNHMDGFWEKKI